MRTIGGSQEGKEVENSLNSQQLQQQQSQPGFRRRERGGSRGAAAHLSVNKCKLEALESPGWCAKVCTTEIFFYGTKPKIYALLYTFRRKYFD